MTWSAIETESDVQVVPDGDLRQHDLNGNCWCRPFWDENILVHNSMDKREEYERGRKAS